MSLLSLSCCVWNTGPSRAVLCRQELACQVLVFNRLGYCHSTFSALAAERGGELALLAGPAGLADLALGLSGYRLPLSSSLTEGIVGSAAAQLAAFSEARLLALVDGLSQRPGLDWRPLLAAAEVRAGLGWRGRGWQWR